MFEKCYVSNLRRAGSLAMAGLVLVVIGGCTEPASRGISYSDALQIYNQELAGLDRLTKQRDALQDQLKSPPDQGLNKLLESAAGALSQEAVGALSKELSGALEDLGEPALNLEEAKASQEKLFGAIEDQAAETKSNWEAKKAQIEDELAKLEPQIAEQQAKVDRAKADRDKAEASRR